MFRKASSPWFRSVLIHATLISALLLAVYWDTRQDEHDTVITLENISLADKVKKVIHTAVHTIGIPHQEPVEHTASAEKTQLAQPTNVPVSEAGGGTLPPSEMQKYLGEVVARINRVKQYPKDAQFNEQEGTVTLLVEVAPDGKILKSEIENAAPFASLNDAALKAIQKIGVLPPLPMQRSIQLHVPIRFMLR